MTAEPQPEPAQPPPAQSPPAPPGSAAPSDRRTLVAVGVAGLIGAAALPLTRLGIGWPICAAALLVVVVLVRGSANGAPGPAGGARADGVWRIAAGAAALFLVSVAAWRAAGWLVAICLLAGVLLGSYALAGGRTWIGLTAGALSLLPATVQGLGWAAGGGRGAAPSTPSGGPGESRGARPARALAGVAVGVVLLVIFGSLFRAADPAFDALVAGWTGGISVAKLTRAALGGLVLLTVAVGVAYLTGHPRSAEPQRGPLRFALRVVEWAVPLAMLDALFATFVWVQVTVLFGGHDYVLAPGGPDYAVHALGGFVELAFVTVLTLGVVALLSVLAGRSTSLELGLLRLLGGVLCGLTLVVIASALTRLGLYADAYGFTAARLLAYATVVWLGLVFVLVLVAGVRLRAAWLPRATVAAATAVLIGLVLVNPEALMARGVLNRMDSPYPVDYSYLSNLSPDAIDELDRMAEPEWSCVIYPTAFDLDEPEPWYAWNAAREHGRDVLARHRLATDCRWPR